MATTSIMELNEMNDNIIKCWVLMETPVDDVISKAISNFAEAGYFVEAKDILEEYDRVNPYDSLMTCEYWVRR